MSVKLKFEYCTHFEVTIYYSWIFSINHQLVLTFSWCKAFSRGADGKTVSQQLGECVNGGQYSVRNMIISHQCVSMEMSDWLKAKGTFIFGSRFIPPAVYVSSFMSVWHFVKVLYINCYFYRGRNVREGCIVLLWFEMSPRLESNQIDWHFCVVGCVVCICVDFFQVLLFPHTVRK